LVDFHGPHDHQLLLSSQWHRGILDRLVDFENQLERYRNLFDEFTQVKNKLDELQAMTSSREREVDLLSHQIKELEQVALEESACEDLLQKKTKINNAEKIHEYINELVQGLGGDANGASENIRQAFGAMRHLNQIDEKTAPLLDLLTQVQDMNEQLLLELRDYAGDLSFDPQQAQEVNNLCDIYDDIKRKYGPTLAEAQAFYQQAKKKYDLLVNLEHNDSQLRKQLNTIEKKLSTYAKEITQKRQMTATKLKKTIERELGDLGIKHVKFEARIEKKDFDDYGADQVTFYISPNIGEDLKPLAEIVSSGEAARVMLALKKALVKVDPIPVLIFDEIDAQIGGRLGSVIGEKLREISRNRQVILITHLPQIASFADTHLKVNKMVKENRAVTIVDALNRQERIKEMAQMMSGEKETRIAIKHANDMLEKASI